MTPEPGDGLTVEYQPPMGPRRRVRFEPRSDGYYDRIEDVWTGCVWRETGREMVDDVVINSGGVVLP